MTRYALYGGWEGDVVSPETFIGIYDFASSVYAIMEESFNDMGAMDWFIVVAVRGDMKNI